METFHTVFRTWVTAPENMGLFLSLAQIIRKRAAKTHIPWHSEISHCFDFVRDKQEGGICLLLRLMSEGYKLEADVWE